MKLIYTLRPASARNLGLPRLVLRGLLADTAKRPFLVSDPERRTILRPHFAPVIEPRRRDVGMAEPLLHLGDIGLVVERVGRCRGAQRMHTQPIYFRADAGLQPIFHDDIAID